MALFARFERVNMTQPLWANIDAWAKAGDVAALRDAALALEQEDTGTPGADASDRAALRVASCENIIRALALTPRPGFAETALDLCTLPRQLARQFAWSRRSGDRRSCAQLLASGQSRETLISLFVQFGNQALHRETLACLLQEMVLRGIDAADVPVLDQFGRQLLAASHPLAWLPLTLTPIERNLSTYLPFFSLRSARWHYPSSAESISDEKIVTDELNPSSDNGTPAVHEIALPSVSDRVRVAVSNWEEGSNGVIEVRLFECNPPLRPDHVTPALLLALRLACIGDVSSEAITLGRMPTGDVLGLLFAAASNGGAYNPGRYGAYGRLEAWQSLGALAGAADQDSVGEVMSKAEECAWFLFDAESGWFQHIAWDIGIVSLSPDGSALRLLAATDTD